MGFTVLIHPFIHFGVDGKRSNNQSEKDQARFYFVYHAESFLLQLYERIEDKGKRVCRIPFSSCR
jgi:hypothetical protein